MLRDLLLPPGSLNCSQFSRILLSFVFHAAEFPRKRHARARAHGGIPHVDAILRQRVPRLQLHRESGIADNVFPADTAVKSLEIQVYPSRREFRTVTARMHGCAHVHINKHTRRSRAAISTARALPFSLSLSISSACLSRTYESIVSHRGNLNEIRSAEETVEDSARFDPEREVKPLGTLD